jgi:L-ascorbate metabolism protein UlaG (beta-lactamase superfamily)
MKNETNPEIKAIYVGGPTIILEIGPYRLMTDPTLDPGGSSFRLNDKMTEAKTAGPATDDLGEIDLVLLSHDQHFDNLDNAGRTFLDKAAAVLTTTSGAGRLQKNSIGLLHWETYTLSGKDGLEITITATPARHGPAGVEKITGDVIGFLLSIGKNGRQIFITGDTTFFEGIVKVSERFNPQYVFIFAGAARPRGPFNVTMSTNDAIDTAAKFPSAILIPIHSEGWSHYTEHNTTLIEAFSILGIDKQLMILEPGIPTLLP